MEPSDFDDQLFDAKRTRKLLRDIEERVRLALAGGALAAGTEAATAGTTVQSVRMLLGTWDRLAGRLVRRGEVVAEPGCVTRARTAVEDGS